VTLETWVLLIFLGVAGLVGAFWSARRIDRQQAKTSDILSRSTEQQQKADELQRREAELLSRWEAVVARLEAVAASWKQQSEAEPSAAPDRGRHFSSARHEDPAGGPGG
jgi:hypothetical protein